MIDYFDFEESIKNINEKIESLSINKVADQNLIKNYQQEKKNLYKLHNINILKYKS